MKVILVKDTPQVGQKNDIVDVSNGHARNFLIPNGFALAATDALVAQAEAEREKTLAERKAQEEALLSELKKVDGETITLEAKANEQGHLFEGITAAQIIAAINTEKATAFTESHISLKKPLKEVGDHALTVAVGEGEASVTVAVKATE